MTRILVLGDSAGTGFGTVTANLGRELLALGEEVRFVSLNEQPNGELDEPFAGRTAVIGAPDGWLARSDDLHDRIERMFTGGLFEDGWSPESAIIIGDVGSLKVSPVVGLIPAGFPAFHYVPIEGVGLPPRWAETWRRISPVAMSEFGADEIAKLGIPRPPVIYHGVDTRTFHPVSAASAIRLAGTTPVVLRSKADCRQFLGWPQDEFIFFRADRHMPRKLYDSLLRCMAPILARHPKTRLIWHCLTVDQGGDLLDERSKYPSAIGERMSSTGIHDQFGGAPPSVLAAMYNAADLYVSTSAEGFGLTIAESLACGVPAVGLGFSAVPEVIGEGGVTVPVGALVANVYSHFWAMPNERLFTEAAEALMLDEPRRTHMGKLGTFHVARQFSWTRAAHQFSELVGQREAVAA